MNPHLSSTSEFKKAARERCAMLLAGLPTIKIEGEPPSFDEQIFSRPDDLPDELRDVYSRVHGEISDMHGYELDEFELCVMIADAGFDCLLFHFERNH